MVSDHHEHHRESARRRSLADPEGLPLAGWQHGQTLKAIFIFDKSNLFSDGELKK